MLNVFLRLLLTIGVPALVTIASHYLLLPGIPLELAEGLGAAPNMSVFALGVMPILSAYLIVEVVAFFVPRWTRMRHEPRGREKLERAVGALTLVLAVFQAYGVARFLRGMEGEFFGDLEISMPVVMASLVGGVFVLFAAQKLVSRQGLVPGLVAFLGVGAALHVGQRVFLLLGWTHPSSLDQAVELARHSGPRALAADLLALVAAGVATWAVVGRRPGTPSVTAGPSGATPYETVRRRLVEPWVPLPAGSFQAYAYAAGLLGLHAFIPMFGSRNVENFVVTFFSPVLFGLTALVALVFARLIHRQKELSDLTRGLDGNERDAVALAWQRELRFSLVPTLIFFAVIIASSELSKSEVYYVPLLVAVGLDLVRAARLELRMPDSVTVREERRAGVVPILREALSQGGVASECRGLAVQSLWQAFAPYAPAEIRVRKSDAEHALKIVDAALVEPVERSAAPDAKVDTRERAPKPKFPSRPTLVVAACLVALVVLLFLPQSPSAPAGPRAKFEVIRVDDTIRPFENIEGAPLEGIELTGEQVTVGDQEYVPARYAMLTLRAGESREAGARRFQRWLSTVPLPGGARFGLEDVMEYGDENGFRGQVTRLRTYVLIGAAEIETDDIVEALTVPDDLTTVVSLKFSAGAARRFEDLTARWVNRRLALVVDGTIHSAPVVKSAIPGGQVTITLGAVEPAQAAVDADRLVRGLMGR